MEETPQNARLDRLLITRIYDPSFDECDVFLPEFRTPFQVDQEEQEMGKSSTAVAKGDSNWIRCSESSLDEFMGDKVEMGIIEEKGVKYQLQMWERAD
jgi:dihydrofolate reductase